MRDELHQMFDAVLDRAREGLTPNDLARVIIRHQGLHSAVVVPLQQADQLDADKVMNMIENVLQSEENLVMDDSFQGMSI